MPVFEMLDSSSEFSLLVAVNLKVGQLLSADYVHDSTNFWSQKLPTLVRAGLAGLIESAAIGSRISHGLTLLQEAFKMFLRIKRFGAPGLRPRHQPSSFIMIKIIHQSD